MEWKDQRGKEETLQHRDFSSFSLPSLPSLLLFSLHLPLSLSSFLVVSFFFFFSNLICLFYLLFCF